MSQSRNPLSLVIGAAITTGALAAGSLFSMDALAHGYMQDAGKAKAAERKPVSGLIVNSHTNALDKKQAASEGKCGEGKCGAGMATGNGDEVVSPRDAASGLPTGKRMHGPMTMTTMDTDKDGRLSRSEFKSAHDGKDDKFAGIDTDKDGFVSQQEFDAHHAAMGKAMGEGKCGEGKCGGKM